MINSERTRKGNTVRGKTHSQKRATVVSRKAAKTAKHDASRLHFCSMFEADFGLVLTWFGKCFWEITRGFEKKGTELDD